MLTSEATQICILRSVFWQEAPVLNHPFNSAGTQGAPRPTVSGWFLPSSAWGSLPFFSGLKMSHYWFEIQCPTLFMVFLISFSQVYAKFLSFFVPSWCSRTRFLSCSSHRLSREAAGRPSVRALAQRAAPWSAGKVALKSAPLRCKL